MAAQKQISYRKALYEWKLYLFVVPSLALILLFSYFPAISAMYHSFFEWTGGDNKRYVGIDNFKAAFKDKYLWKSFITVGILIVANLVKMLPSILVAVTVHRLKSDRWQYWYRVALVIPMIVPGLVTLFIWKFFFDPNLGALNAVLDVTHLKDVLVSMDTMFKWGGVFSMDYPIGWLSNEHLIIPSLVLWGFPWIGAVGVLIYLAGLQTIDGELYEAANLDGVNSFQKFLYIELPLITTQIRLNLILMCIGTIQGFGLQLLLLGDQGGPGGKGMVPGLWMFYQAFNKGQFGYACSIGIILFFFILTLTYINNKFVRVER